MAENDGQEKTEDATDKRIRESREKGNVPRSQDLGAAFILLVGLLSLKVLGRPLLETLMGYTSRILGELDDARLNVGNFVSISLNTLMYMIYMLGPFLLLTVVGAIIIHWLQFGILFSFDKLIPKASNIKFNVFTWGIELFKTKAIMRLLMGLLKVIVVAVVGFISLEAGLPDLLKSMDFGIGQTLVVISDLFMTVSIRIALILLTIGFVDYLYQRWQYFEDMKMSKQEVKDEMKQMDGDPQIKARRMQMARQALMNGMMNDAGKADVVVTNPTEYAVALKYEPNSIAPVVVAKGRNVIAQKIRKIAIENNIPIQSNPPLARQLFRDIEVGQLIPPELYKAVIEVLSVVWAQQGKKVAG